MSQEDYRAPRDEAEETRLALEEGGERLRAWLEYHNSVIRGHYWMLSVLREHSDR